MAVSESENAGGQGESVPTRGDMILYRQAYSGAWPVSDGIKKTVVNEMLAIVQGEGEATNRERISAAKVLAAVDGVNAARERIETPIEHKHSHEHRLTDAQRTERLTAILERARQDRARLAPVIDVDGREQPT